MAELAKQPVAPPQARVLSIFPPCAPMGPSGGGGACLSPTTPSVLVPSYLRTQGWEVRPPSSEHLYGLVGKLLLLPNQIWGSLSDLGPRMGRRLGVGASSGLGAGKPEAPLGWELGDPA